MGVDRDPAPAFKFYVELEGITVGEFTECAGLSIEREVETYAEGGVNNFVHVLPGKTGGKGKITLKRGVSTSEALWDWYQEGLHEAQPKLTNMSVLLSNTKGDVVRRWDFVNAIPVKWVGPQLNTSSTDYAVETLEIALGGESSAGTIHRSADSSTSSAETSATAAATESNQIDNKALAKKVFALLKKDLQVERERLGNKLDY